MDAATIALVSGIIGYALPPLNVNDQGAVEFAHVGIPEDTACSAFQPKFNEKSSIDDAVNEGDYYQVVLKNARIGDHLPRNWSAPLLKSHSIAVMANAFEMATEAEKAVSGFDFSTHSFNNAKIIYFNDDVREKQFINQTQVPMFGPIEYHGNPVGISVFVAQVASNEKSKELSGLFSELADLGQKTTDPASPVLPALRSIGKSLIEKKGDDRLLRYDAMLLSHQAAMDKTNVRSAFLRYGDYVMIRQQDRTKPINWGELSYNYDNSQIYKGKNCEVGQEVDSMAYGVVHVTKAKRPAFTSTQTLASLKTALETSAKEGPMLTEELSKTLKALELNKETFKSIHKTLTVFLGMKTKQTGATSVDNFELRARLKTLEDEMKTSSKSVQNLSDAQLFELCKLIVEITEDETLTMPINKDTVYDSIKQKIDPAASII